MKPIRILAIGHSYALRVNRAIAREVAKDDDFQVTIAAPNFFQGDLRPVHCEPEPKDSPLAVVPIPTHWTKQIHVFRYDAKSLRQLLLLGQFDGVHAWEEPYIFAGYQIAKAVRQTRGHFCFRTAQSLNKHYPPPFSFFEKTVLRSSKLWIAGGKSVFENLVSRGYSRSKGRIITLAVDTAAFKPHTEPLRLQVRQELGLDAPVIGYVGRLVPAKGLRVLMKALEGIEPALPWSLLLLGSGPMQAEIEQWARRRGWERRVRIHLAKHDDVPRYLSAMDMMVAPSQTTRNWKEQFGRMLIEAFACGVPVIASDSGEIPFVVQDAGIIAPEKDTSAWRRGIEQLLASASLRDALRRKGFARVREYSAAHVAGQFRGFYRELVHG
ncbi:MAG: glycosyltransferase family 4 protein [Acidobacteriaceae bacterium]|nr:glycosyltransferase family 4 protein [Acidobacteriaceae bacterium]